MHHLHRRTLRNQARSHTLTIAMEDDMNAHERAKTAPPTIDWTFIRNTEQRIAALHLNGGSLRTKVLELCDVANTLDRHDFTVGSTASHVTQRKRKEIVEQMNRAEAEDNRNDEVVRKLEHELSEHWATYAAFHCRTFSDCVRERLPKELRMMVFEAFWENATHTITDWNIKALNTKPKDPVALVESWSGRDTGHCFEARFVGPDMKREISEAWWRMSVFQLKSFGLIPNLLNKEFWSESIKDKVRTVEVQMSYREDWRGRRFANFSLNTDYLFNLSHVTAIKLSISNRDMRRLKFTTEERQNGFLEAASRMFPALEKVQKGGYDIAVILDTDIEINIGEMNITKEEWRKQICEAVEEFDDAHRDAAEERKYSRCWPLTPRSDTQNVRRTRSCSTFSRIATSEV